MAYFLTHLPNGCFFPIRSGGMRYGWVLLMLIGLGGCKKGDDPARPLDTIDELTGSTWVRYGFKNPVNGKEVYYYLTFLKNQQVDGYVMYDKRERSPDNQNRYTYAPGTAPVGAPLGGQYLNFTLNGVTRPVEIRGNRLTYRAPTGDAVYTKQ